MGAADDDGYHARLSPSSAKRWLGCPGSVLLIESLPSSDNGSSYAEEGTCAHDLGEIKARRAIGQLTDEEFADAVAAWELRWPQYRDSYDEMHVHTDDYAALIVSRAARHPGSIVMLERRVYPGIDECDGTADAVIVSPVHVEAIDLKYGAGVAVGVFENPQTRLYAVGALEDYGDLLGEVTEVYATIFQPRVSVDPLTESMTADELRDWRDDAAQTAAIALKPGAPFGPSKDACRWCPASGRCPAQTASVFANDLDTDPVFMTPSEMADALGQVSHIRQWLDKLEAQALAIGIEKPGSIPGYKVIQAGGNRKVKDHNRAVDVLLAAGFTSADFMKEPPEPELKGIGGLEALLGKAEFKALLMKTGIVTKPPGKTSIVPADDPRPAFNANAVAAELFTDIEETGELL